MKKEVAFSVHYLTFLAIVMIEHCHCKSSYDKIDVELRISMCIKQSHRVGIVYCGSITLFQYIYVFMYTIMKC